MARPPQDPPDDGYCAACGKPCIGVWEDVGIGPYEYWGQRGFDSRWDVVSDCCADDVLSEPPKPHPCPTDPNPRVQMLLNTLYRLASWDEGYVVDPSFDEPGAAAVAREALEAWSQK